MCWWEVANMKEKLVEGGLGLAWFGDYHGYKLKVGEDRGAGKD